MTLFALDAEPVARGVVAVRGRGERFEPGNVALQAARNDGAFEIGDTVAIAGTIYLANVGPIRHG
jgi:hypothetical protein